jgi:hypothetical protein
MKEDAAEAAAIAAESGAAAPGAGQSEAAPVAESRDEPAVLAVEKT